ncbi:MAG TPA: response regulator [Abditibacteriaceae bacterium]|jgi:DNA-binding response OmpR family regulator
MMNKGDIEKPVSKGRLLIVEDDKAILALWDLRLRMAGYDTMTAQSVAEAKTWLENSVVDLVITDWHLPDGIGGEVCQGARQLLPIAPVIVISAATDDQVAEILSYTPDAYFTKSVEPTTLVATIERLLEAGRAEKSE